jgi:hypothetical protein
MLAGINFSPSLAFIGDYAVNENSRGLGVGHAMWKRMLEHVGSERNLVLFSAEEMFPIYRDLLGFKCVSDKRVLRYEGIPVCDQLARTLDDTTLKVVNSENIQQVIDYDQGILDGVRREIFLTESAKVKEDVLLAAFDGENRVKGYCLANVSNLDFILIQPLFADSKEIAEILLSDIFERKKSLVEKRGVWMQVWSDNQSALEIVEKMGIKFTCSEPVLSTKEIVYLKNMDKIIFSSSASFYFY